MHTHAHQSVVSGATPADLRVEGETGTTIASESDQYVSFSCSGKQYGVGIMQVQEIRSWSRTTEMPDQHHAAVGVMDIRGQVIEVFDLAAALGIGRTNATEGHVVLVLRVEDLTFGILVDAVSDIIQVSRKDLKAPPGAIGRDGGRGVVRGIAKQGDTLVAILDMSKIASTKAGEDHA